MNTINFNVYSTASNRGIFRLCSGYFSPAVALLMALSSARAADQSPNNATSESVVSSTEPHREIGVIQGRVQNSSTGDYLEFTKITVEGTALETFTNAYGEYQFANVPVGTVKVTAFRTGIAEVTQTVTVVADQPSVLDFSLSYSADKTDKNEDVIVMPQFVVKALKQMDGAAIAINTQRFASNSMNVVAANEFGPVADGGVGEVLKSLPGVAITRGGFGDAYLISLNGAPPRNVPITIGGVNLANAADGLTRGTGLQQTSINSFARLETINTLTPESPGAALSGYVNLVPLSAFERSTPKYTLNVQMFMRDNARDFQKSPGAGNEPHSKVTEGVDFQAIVPVTMNFGFTVATSLSELYTSVTVSQNSWAGASTATNGVGLPDTTPDNPYLVGYQFRDRPTFSKRQTLSATADYKLSRNDVLSAGVYYGNSDATAFTRQLGFNITGVTTGNYALDHTYSNNGASNIQQQNTYNKVGGPLYTEELVYRHNGPIWKAEAVVGYSTSDRYNQNTDKGFFNTVTAQRSKVTTSFTDISYLRPDITTVDSATGNAVDPFDLNSYRLTNATSLLLKARTTKRTAYANIRREFDWTVPVTFKAGFDVRDDRFDIRQPTTTYTFVGADGVANTADDNASIALDPSFSQRVAPYGFPRMDWMSNQALYALYLAHPSYFTTSATAISDYISTINSSAYANELVSAVYLRGDVGLLSNRLKIVGGLRAEQTNGKGQGVLTNPALNTAGYATTSLEYAQATTIDRGASAKKEYIRYLPSINATYNIQENLVARAGYYWSVGRPSYSQYTGSLTLPDTSFPNSVSNRIELTNVDVKAWTAQTYTAGLEYYFKKVGIIAVNVFTRNIKDFFGSNVSRQDDSFFTEHGLDPAIYGAYNVATQYNLDSPVRMSGISVNYKQELSSVVAWMRGFQIFANLTSQRITGDDAGNFVGFVPQTYNWGIGYSRSRYSFRTNWNYTSAARRGPVFGRGIAGDTYNWQSKRLVLDLSAQYELNKTFSLFMNLANIGAAPLDNKAYGSTTPDVATFRNRTDFGAQWTFGVKSVF